MTLVVLQVLTGLTYIVHLCSKHSFKTSAGSETEISLLLVLYYCLLPCSVQTTIRVWQYSTGKLLKTFDVGRSRGNGMMDCRRMPNKGSNQALFTVSDGLGGL